MSAPWRLLSPGFLLSVGLLSQPTQAQQIWVVDDQLCCNADFATVHEAVDAAADGDIVLIKDGVYKGVIKADINAKGLTLIGDGDDVLIASDVHVRDLASDQHVVFRNIEFNFAVFDLNQNRGSIWFEDCVAVWGDEGTIFAKSCDELVLTRCSVEGDWGGGSALWARNSHVALYDSTILGGVGYAGHSGTFPGGHAVEMHGGFLFASNTHFEGGETDVHPGGDGLLLASGQPEAHTMACTFVGGVGRPDGEPLRIVTGTHQALTGTPRHVEMSTANRYGNDMTLEFQGEPFDLVYLPHNFGPGFDWQPTNRGVLLLDPTRVLNFRIGFLPSSGQKTLQVVTPNLPGLLGLNFYAQGWFFGADGLTHSAPSVATLLDPSF